MRRLVATAVAVLGLLGPSAGTVRAEVTAEQVRTAIERGIACLFALQCNDGSWPERNAYWRDKIGYPGGVSALCTLALLNAGVELDDPRMRKAIDYQRSRRPDKTYEISLQTMIFARATPSRDRERIVRNVQWLEKAQLAKGPNAGAWCYELSRGGRGDNSNSQFALLALHEAERVGVVAGEQTWRLAKTYWENSQNDDGSWGYLSQDRRSTGSMTCAGLASLVIAADRMQQSGARVSRNHIECCIASRPGDGDRIERAIQWLGSHYSVTSNPGSGRTWTIYYLYGLERVGRLTSRRFIPLAEQPGRPNRADWYREGADYLVRSQDSLSGFWPCREVGEAGPLVGTSFAMLFLSKGRWPVLMAKLQHGEGTDWNRYRSDVGNLTRYVESRWKRDLTWQVIDLRRASVDDMIQTPVLYLCGSRSPLAEDAADRKEMAEKLRDYLDRGGFLLAGADCGGADFDRGFRDLMRDVFPEPEYKLRLLEPEHPIWHAEEKIDAWQMRPVWGIDFGCRTSVVYAPPDPPRPSLSCLWELSRPGRGVKYSLPVEAQVNAGMSLGINALAYATGRELKTKDDFFRAVPTRRPADRVERGRLDVANLRHPGGCNVAPRALVHLMDAAGDELSLRAHVRPEPLDITDPALFDFPLVFMHGRNAFRLTDGERRQLRKYIERGGMLLADSVCGSRAFGDSFRREMTAMFSDRKLQPIRAGDPLWSPAYGGFDLRTVSRRDSEPAAAGKPPRVVVRKVAPELEAIRFDDRWGVVFSPHDLSCSLEKQNSLDCPGYTPEDAARIGLNVILYVLQQ
jgi:hypothetical protein